MKRGTRLALMAVFAATAVLNPHARELGFSASSPMWTLFTWQLVHGNIVHMLCNGWVLYLMLGRQSYVREMPASLVLAFAVSLALKPLTPIPVVGLSGMLLCEMGIAARNLKPTKENFLYYGIFLAFSFLLPGMAGLLHLSCFLIGLTYGILLYKRR